MVHEASYEYIQSTKRYGLESTYRIVFTWFACTKRSAYYHWFGRVGALGGIGVMTLLREDELT